jgi:2-amino-4-hydroxy-6-hydroxymethyldihydropteridine diphosphokinase
MEHVRVLISLGSNLGNREKYIDDAIIRLTNHPKLQFIRKTSLLENKAILYEDQPDFLNAIAEFRSTLSAELLLDLTQKIEQDLGRVFRFLKGPREIDIDILDFGGFHIQTDRITLPHPGIKDREYLFVLLQELGLWEELNPIN